MTQPEILVDSRGRRCPIPTLRLRRACEKAAPGAIVRLLADDPMARIDVPHFVGEAGLELLHMETVGAVMTALVRKPLQCEAPGVETEGGCGAPLGGMARRQED